MDNPYIEVDLMNDDKKLILELASFYIMDKTTEADLKNPRKKWIRFTRETLTGIIGELSYHCNRCKKKSDVLRLDGLCEHLEIYERMR